MGYGGVINTIVDPFNIGATDAPKSPKPSKVGKDYLGLIQAYNQSLPSILQSEQTYKPQFTASSLQNLAGSLNGINGAPGLIDLNQGALESSISNYNTLNPSGAALRGQLNDAASAGLSAGSQLAPGDIYNVTQGVRSDWANRGFAPNGNSQLDEALRLATAGEGLRQNRQQFAGGVSAMNDNWFQNMQGNSILPAAAGFSQASNATIVPTNQAYDMFNTTYNAQAAAKIAGANNEAAANNSY